MTQETVRCTHKGWFGICPVYMADPHSQSPFVAPRSVWLDPVFSVSAVLMIVWFVLRGSFSSSFEPGWPLVVTGELDVPVDMPVLEEPDA